MKICKQKCLAFEEPSSKPLLARLLELPPLSIPAGECTPCCTPHDSILLSKAVGPLAQHLAAQLAPLAQGPCGWGLQLLLHLDGGNWKICQGT
jgi:hypothetical protein